jgi:hypothetical protein
MVVNAEGKGLAKTRSGDRQEEDRKGTTVEVSKGSRRCQNRGGLVTAGLAPTKPGYGRSGIRHERWPELAKRRLSGTWEPEAPMQTEKPQVEATTRARVRKRSLRVGLPHSSEEAGQFPWSEGGRSSAS